MSNEKTEKALEKSKPLLENEIQIAAASESGGKYKLPSLDMLDVKNDKALLLCDKLLEKMQPYHKDFVGITWKNYNLRQYLNNEFLNKFNQATRNKIVESSVLNVKNPWFGTYGGVNTPDYL